MVRLLHALLGWEKPLRLMGAAKTAEAQFGEDDRCNRF